MKKIGIMTFHRADNLGAVLQAYALQSAIREKINADAEIIDYQCSRVESDRKKVKGFKSLLLQMYYVWKHKSVEKFRKEHLILSERCSTESISEVAAKYDAFITGSDQVWNYECSGWDDAYFLNFVPVNKDKYSYAASIGNYCFTESEKQHVRKLLQDFSCISVREASARKELDSMGLERTILSPDPVVLLPMERWKKVMSPRRCRQRYVFVYLIQQDVNVMRSAIAYAEAHNCKIISNKNSLEFIINGGPEDFLSWIYYAECVFTNSFHGTAFALMFNRPLAADIQLVNGGINHRVLDMLECTGAVSCAISSEIGKAFTPDAQSVLGKMRSDAFDYLSSVCGNK